MSASERARRNAEIATSRALGLTWAQVAAKHGISERSCRQAVKDHDAAAVAAAEVGVPANLDAERLFAKALAATEEVLDTARARQATADNDSAWSGVARTRLSAADQLVRMLGLVGLLPAPERVVLLRLEAAQARGELRSLRAPEEWLPRELEPVA